MKTRFCHNQNIAKLMVRGSVVELHFSISVVIPFGLAWVAAVVDEELIFKEVFNSFDDMVNYLQGDAISGDIIYLSTGGHQYEVVSASEVDFDLETSAGIKLKVLPGENGYDVQAFGANGDGDLELGTGSDNYVAFQKAADAVLRDGGGEVYVPDGVYRLSHSGSVAQQHESVWGRNRMERPDESG